ncbi:MAG: hypothetical protein ACRD2X_14630 [Vicinamibacteraceae bacterium]
MSVDRRHFIRIGAATALGASTAAPSPGGQSERPQAMRMGATPNAWGVWFPTSPTQVQAALNGFWRDFTFDENRVKAGRALPDGAAFSKAWARAVSKDTALTIRVTLGDTSGARFDWHDGAWHTSIDTRGKPTGIYEQIGRARP